jgi:hypothetical protein
MRGMLFNCCCLDCTHGIAGHNIQGSCGKFVCFFKLVRNLNPQKNRKSFEKIKIKKQTISKIKRAALFNPKKAKSRAQVFSKFITLKLLSKINYKWFVLTIPCFINIYYFV